MDFNQYNRENKNLPDFMKDFHDQKDLFKLIQDWGLSNETFKKFPNSWRDNHVFTIDYFLTFMACHGYKLQKIRAKIEFCDIQERMKDFRHKKVESFSKMMENSKK